MREWAPITWRTIVYPFIGGVVVAGIIALVVSYA